MIIDCHAPVSGPKAYWAYKAGLVAHRGSHNGGLTLSDQEILAAWNANEMAPMGHLDHMKSCQIDVQFISPQPFQMMHSEKPAKIVHDWTAVTNDLIRRSCTLLPDKLLGIGGLPQMPGVPIEDTFEELTRCVKTLGFKGVVLDHWSTRVPM